MNNIPATILLVIPLVWNCLDSHKLTKRVINGTPFNGRPSTYGVIRYYGVITSAHRNTFVRKLFSLLGEYGSVMCSGALIAPRIFQTACHCIAKFDLYEKAGINPPIVDDHWESRSVIYFGVSNRYGDNSMETYSPVFTEKFIVHQKCARVGRKDNPTITFDYGLIRLPFSWINPDDRENNGNYPWTEIDFAPAYTVSQIRSFHTYALQHQLVCLHIGFGRFRNRIADTSDVLRHGWAALIPQELCTSITYFRSSLGYLEDLSFVNWDCAGNFSIHDQHPGEGDSGSPVTCDNNHFAVLSGATYRTDEAGNEYDVTTKYHPLIHELFVNAVEYRKSLIQSIEVLESFKDLVDNFYKAQPRIRRRQWHGAE